MPVPLMSGKRAFLLLVVALLLLPVVGWFEWPYLLQVVDIKNDRVVLEFPFRQGEDLTLEYTHSVQLTPVREIFRVQDGQLVLVETVYESLGVGLPYGAEGNFENREGKFFLRGLSRHFSRVSLWVSPIPAQRLKVKGREFPLLDLVGPDTLVEIRVSHRLFQLE